MKKYRIIVILFSLLVSLCSCAGQKSVSYETSEDAPSPSGQSEVTIQAESTGVGDEDKPTLSIIEKTENGTIFLYRVITDVEIFELTFCVPEDWEAYNDRNRLILPTINDLHLVFSEEDTNNYEEIPAEYILPDWDGITMPEPEIYSLVLDEGSFAQNNGFAGNYIIRQLKLWSAYDDEIDYRFDYGFRLNDNLIIHFEFKSILYEPEWQIPMFESIVSSVEVRVVSSADN